MRFKVLLLLIVVSRTISARAQSKVILELPDQNPFTQMLPVEFCEVTRHPQRYDGKTIRIRTIISKHFESSGLRPYNWKDCWDWMRVAGYDCPDETSCSHLLQKLQPTRGDAFRVTSLPVLISGRFSYRRFLTAEEAKLFGFHHYELIVTRFEELLEPPQ